MRTHSVSGAYKCKQTKAFVKSGKDFSHWQERKEGELHFLVLNVQMASCCGNSASSWHRCLWVFPIFYLLLPQGVVLQYSKTHLMSSCYCRSNSTSPPHLPRSLCTSIYLVLSFWELHWQRSFCLLGCLFLIQISFLLFLPQQKLVGAWVKGAGQGDGEAAARSQPAGASAASPQAYSHGAAWGTTRPQPSLCSRRKIGFDAFPTACLHLPWPPATAAGGTVCKCSTPADLGVKNGV